MGPVAPTPLHDRLIVSLFAFAILQASVQSNVAPRCFIRQFGVADRLPQPFVCTLTQDHAGYLWAGTAKGVVLYDGREFVAFTTKEGLAEDFVTALYVQPRTGQLQVRHYQGGVSR